MKLHVVKLGKGKPVVILHGLFGLSDNWYSIGKKLSENYSVYLIDLRNHGQSPHLDEMSYELMSEDIFELFIDERIGEANLIGHSLGGKIAMRFAQDHGEKIGKLVVVDVALREYPADKTILNALRSFNPEKVLSRKEAAAKLSAYIGNNAIMQLFHKNLYWKEHGKLAWKFNLDGIMKNLSAISSGLTFSAINTVPALFIKGGLSGYIRPDDTGAILGAFPSAIFTTVEGAGHWVHADKPDEFLKVLMAFLQK